MRYFTLKGLTKGDKLNSNIPKIRVRFAPSPTGIMHLGNVRAALLNFLFARQKVGTFILRIEDTDFQRNLDSAVEQIEKDLSWLNLKYDEGPYFQSKNFSSYQESLEYLIEKKLVYKCFCTPEILARKKEKQVALKQAPRYDKTCLKLDEKTILEKVSQKIPFIWRFEVPEGTLEFRDMAKGSMSFNLANFSDFAITRSDSSFTFIFANCVDDIKMKMSHVFRGEDHLSNTVMQVLIYKAFSAQIPVFWHLPIICNLEGSKLSKRDFGFSLNDLKKAGFLHQAITNYLALIGNSFKEEIMDLESIVKNYDFQNVQSASTVKYDEQKLRWVNQQWIQKLPIEELAKEIKPFIIEKYPQSLDFDASWFINIAELVRTDIFTLKEVPELIDFIFKEPEINKEISESEIIFTAIDKLNIPKLEFEKIANFLENKKLEDILTQEIVDINKKYLYQLIRLLVTGKIRGPQIPLLAKIVPHKEFNYLLK